MPLRLALFACLLGLFATFAKAETAPSAARWQPAPGDVIRFNVLRQGQAFGTHTVRFETAASGALVARTEVELRAGLGPITLYRYDLDATETWLNGELQSVSGQVNDDGNKRTVFAARSGGALSVKGSDFTGTAPAGVVPASHWNYAQTQVRKLLSTEDGEILDVTVDRVGRETIRAGGKTIEANRYRLDSAVDVDLWYDDAGRWVKLAFKARGQSIEYVLDSLY